jgi:hypothetical protein
VTNSATTRVEASSVLTSTRIRSDPRHREASTAPPPRAPPAARELCRRHHGSSETGTGRAERHLGGAAAGWAARRGGQSGPAL